MVKRVDRSQAWFDSINHSLIIRIEHESSHPFNSDCTTKTNKTFGNCVSNWSHILCEEISRQNEIV